MASKRSYSKPDVADQKGAQLAAQDQTMIREAYEPDPLELLSEWQSLADSLALQKLLLVPTKPDLCTFTVRDSSGKVNLVVLAYVDDCAINTKILAIQKKTCEELLS